MVRLIHADPMLMLNSQGKAAHEVQSSTLELINGLVSLVQNSSIPDVSHEAMEALLVLHQPEKIEMWNPEAPINTFWDLSSQVLFSMSQKLIQHLIVNYTDVLKWLRKILECRNQFLQKHCEYANVGSSIGTYLQFRQFLLSQKNRRKKFVKLCLHFLDEYNIFYNFLQFGEFCFIFFNIFMYLLCLCSNFCPKIQF